jgi:hypothetical protein
MVDAVDMLAVSEIEHRLKTGKLDPWQKQRVFRAIELAGGRIVSEATLAIAHNIIARIDAGFPVALEELQNCLYAIAASTDDV